MYISEIPYLVDEWSDKNEFTPADYLTGSNKKVMWIGKCGHEWIAKIADRVNGHGCPYCAGKILKGFNDLTTTRPDMIEEWSDINDIDPTTISERSTRLVWWKCKDCGYEWRAAVKTKAKGSKCPRCRHEEAEAHYRELIHKRDEKRRLRYQKQIVLFEEQLNKNEIEYVKNDSSIIGMPLQYYIPSRRIAVEFMMRDLKTMQYYRNERAKNALCLGNNIKMIRILSKEAEEYDNCLCIIKKEDSYECLQEVMRLLMKMIGIKSTSDPVDQKLN